MAAVRISVGVQHHPARAHLIGPLLGRLKGLKADVVTDPFPDDPLPNPLRTYVLTLESTPAWATHRLVLQDDGWPCDGFPGLMRAAVKEKPDSPVAFFTPGCAPHRADIIRAMLKGERWAALHSMWYPTVALCWPVTLGLEFAAWAKDELGTTARGEAFRGDDGPVGTFCQRRKIVVWATAPSLVEHPDVERSLIGRPNRAGANRARVAAAFIDG